MRSKSSLKLFRFVIPQLDVFEAAELYQKEGIPVIILAGKNYGLGSSRDWAAKGPFLLVLLVCLGLGGGGGVFSGNT